MENVNPWVLLIAGALLGWLGGWLMELLFFRRKAETSSTAQIDLLTTQLASCEGELQNLRLTAAQGLSPDTTAYEAQIAALEAEVKRLRAAARSRPRRSARPWAIGARERRLSRRWRNCPPSPMTSRRWKASARSWPPASAMPGSSTTHASPS